jgi:hypothetical protein
VNTTGIKALARLKRLERFEFLVVVCLFERNDVVSFCIQHLPHLKVIGDVSDRDSFGTISSFFHHNLMHTKKNLQLEHYRYGMINPGLRDTTAHNL